MSELRILFGVEFALCSHPLPWTRAQTEQGKQLQDVANFNTGVVDGARPGGLCVRTGPLSFKNRLLNRAFMFYHSSLIHLKLYPVVGCVSEDV